MSKYNLDVIVKITGETIADDAKQLYDVVIRQRSRGGATQVKEFDLRTCTVLFNVHSWPSLDNQADELTKDDINSELIKRVTSDVSFQFDRAKFDLLRHETPQSGKRRAIGFEVIPIPNADEKMH